ncbi:MAG: palindromic element RPE2 domain-containing protein, partial [Rickettsia aeschlimannii]
EPKLETVVNSASFGYKEQGAKPITNRRATSDEVGGWVSLDYINYLLNVNLLIYNFMQDKDYSKELRIVKSRLLSQDIRNILNNLEAYNNYLFSKSSSTEVIFPTNHKWLEKFIKIEKKTSAMMIKEQDKALILENLNYLINFLYSEKFMQEFVNKDV